MQISAIGSFPLRSSGAPRNPQVYNGQRATLQNQSLTTTVTAGLGAIGLPNTKFIIGGGYLLTSFDPNGPNTATFKNLNLYQSFADGKVEIKAGFSENYVEYVGLFAGGNVTLTSGLSTLIPIQVGLSAEPGPTPAVNVRLNGAKGSYVKFGVQRSTNPLGNETEVRNHGIGLDWHQKDAKALYIGEVGLRRESTPSQRALWLRAGYIYNTSPYQRFLGGTDKNQAVYALADYQLTRPDDQMFFRGLYVGASAEVAPKNVNAFAKSAELRAYYVGPLNARPTDAVNLTVTWNRFSSDLHKARLLGGEETERYQIGTAVSYAVHVQSGITIVPAFQYIVHPSLFPGYRNAVLGNLSLFLAL